jgi:hypothetical protein
MNIIEQAQESRLMMPNGNVARHDEVIFFLTTAQFATLGTEVYLYQWRHPKLAVRGVPEVPVVNESRSCSRCTQVSVFVSFDSVRDRQTDDHTCVCFVLDTGTVVSCCMKTRENGFILVDLTHLLFLAKQTAVKVHHLLYLHAHELKNKQAYMNEQNAYREDHHSDNDHTVYRKWRSGIKRQTTGCLSGMEMINDGRSNVVDVYGDWSIWRLSFSASFV